MTVDGAEKNQSAELLPHVDTSQNKEYYWKCPECGTENAMVWCCCSECGHINWPEG